ncbi:2-phospho-L-lactate guanylyltransferase [Actinomycetospora sp. NBRC 106375]|uniref:2-phospho-L-lactate guanylyltransferase n=1 Tax=Actinomycetospora sp. NBRC 106375 TaxID=3032207 RepID=UPI0024A5765B|nr:2-phospho-L-lactate guanylyltransferase [Actinomycetospora sp. NBRC 106375]GLZ48997.1 2-phospho-L-lactate guanylyltransferase [Actinomycetospora sp. NBRC 106375]
MHDPVDVVVPVKELRRAKSRLAPAVADLPGDDADREHAHRALALALARDTLRAARAAAGTGRLVVVTAEPAVTLAGAGEPHEVVRDTGGGLNAAVRLGARHLRPSAHGPTAALQADLPALRPAELDDALARAAALFADGAERVFVADHAGTGTTLLVAAAGRALRPRFGPGSAGAHAASGAVALDGDWPGLRGDVDTVADLARARGLGAGPETSAWLTPVMARR